MRDEHGDRMKKFERLGTEDRLMPGLPIIARIDGKTFSTYTRGMQRPYDADMMMAMISTTEFLVEQMQADVGYTQSDEITLLWRNEDLRAELPFGGRRFKLISLCAAYASAHFIRIADSVWKEKRNRTPVFDCRVWQVPNRMEAANTLLWRVKDAVKNSISMAASAHYSPKQLHGKTSKERQEMLFVKGINWNDYPSGFKRGTWVRRLKSTRLLTDEELTRIPEEYRPSGPVERTDIVVEDIPPFGKLTNRVEVLFEGAKPVLDRARVVEAASTIAVQEYACPHCDATVGEPCRTPQRRKLKYPHAERIRMVPTKDINERCAIGRTNLLNTVISTIREGSRRRGRTS